MTPSVGRIVHFFPPVYSIVGDPSSSTEAGPAHAAIITHVHDDETVALTVFGIEHDTKVPFAKFGDGEPGTWVWPPRV